MKANRIQNQNEININEANQSAVENTVEVLYQKLGDKWYAFSMVGDEVYMGSVSQDEIDSRGSPNIPHGNA